MSGKENPPGRYPPGPGTPPGPCTPPGPSTPPKTRYTPQTSYTPRTRYTPRDQVHPPGTRYTPPGPGTPPPTPGAANSGIRSTIGRYASYCNAFLSMGVMGEWVFHCFFVLIKLLIHWCNGQKQSLSLVNNKNENINNDNDKTSSPPI